MKRIAFYAPMKPPDHPTPSGDREMARALIAALQQAGYSVDLVSRLQSRDGKGDPQTQRRIRDYAAREAERLAGLFDSEEPPDLWFTYHLYHKAPDLLGPALSEKHGIPYVVAEASLAAKRRDGPWADGYAQSLAAIRRADRIFQLNPDDSDGLRNTIGCALPIVPLDPFLVDPPTALGEEKRQQIRREMAENHGLDDAWPWLLAVGMMRDDAKRQSYALLAKALALAGVTKPLLIVGDGPARPEIETLFSGRRQTAFLGALDRDRLNEIYGIADLLVWPAISEAYGMALLEAQASGLPVVAGDRPGVAGIVRHGETGLLTPEGDAEAFGKAVSQLVADASMCLTMSIAAVAGVHKRHSLSAAAACLKQALDPLMEREK
ncbi:MAG: glycosyltransferase family 4 protein [Alphaproteobacteria bacterium]